MSVENYSYRLEDGGFTINTFNDANGNKVVYVYAWPNKTIPLSEWLHICRASLLMHGQDVSELEKR